MENNKSVVRGVSGRRAEEGTTHCTRPYFKQVYHFDAQSRQTDLAAPCFYAHENEVDYQLSFYHLNTSGGKK